MIHTKLATMIRDRARSLGITGPASLQNALRHRGCVVHRNAVARWWRGETRPHGDRLEALLDVLGLLHDDQRRQVRELAYVPQGGAADSAAEPC